MSPEQIELTRGRARALIGHGYLLRGDLGKSLHYRTRALKNAHQLGEPDGIAFACAMKCEEHAIAGTWDDALQYAEQGVAAGSGPGMVTALYWRAWVLLFRGLLMEAARDATEAYATPEAVGHAQNLQFAGLMLSLIDLESDVPRRPRPGRAADPHLSLGATVRRSSRTKRSKQKGAGHIARPHR